MLKKFIQLFAESFLKSKYEHIAFQCGPSTEGTQQIIAGEEDQFIISPFNGYAVLQIGGNDSPTNTWFRLENKTRKVSYLTNANSTWKWATIPIQTGDTLIVNVGTSSAGSLWLVPSEASK